jgi:parallel beta-helix repeat protein
MVATAATAMPGAQNCDAATYAALTAPNMPADKPYRLTCSVTLKKGDNIPRRIQLLGATASGVRIDCNGGAIGYEGIVPPQQGKDVKTGNPFANPTVLIGTLPDGQGWSAPTDISVSRCMVHGNIRTSGIYAKEMFERSRQSDFTKFAQDNAPRRINISDTVIVGYRHVPLYVGVGTTYLTFQRSRIIGSGDLAAYFDLESGHNKINSSKFSISTNREIIAVDGSAYNIISGNIFTLSKRDGIHLYRNCGEDGIIRHQSPSNNIIEDNKFYVPSKTLKIIVINSRSGKMAKSPERDPKICDLDKGYNFGSSKNDDDGGINNKLLRNEIFIEKQ